MAKIIRSSIRSLNSAGRSAYKVADRAFTGLFRLATTDHTGITTRLINMPTMGFLDSLKFILMQLLLSILASILAAGMTFILIAYGIPFLIHGLFFM